MSDLPQISTVSCEGSPSPKTKSNFKQRSKGLSKTTSKSQVAATYASSGTRRSRSTRWPTARGRDDQRPLLDQPAAVKTGVSSRGSGRRSCRLFRHGASRTYSKEDAPRSVRPLREPLGPGPEGMIRRPRSRPPKQPIIFWLEKTVPFKYRKPITRGDFGVESAAYEKAGFTNCHRGHRQQPDDADWSTRKTSTTTRSGGSPPAPDLPWAPAA